MCLSSERSATSRFNRLFSSSTWRKPTQFAHAQMRILLFPGVKGRVTDAELPAEVADRGARSRLAGWHRRSALQRIVTASSIHSFRRGPPKPPCYSRFDLPSFSGETSQASTARSGGCLRAVYVCSFDQYASRVNGKHTLPPCGRPPDKG